MARTPKKRATDNAWKRRNMATITCRLYNTDADAFRAYAAAHGRSVNEILREYIASCLGRPLERRTKGDAPPEGDGE